MNNFACPETDVCGRPETILEQNTHSARQKPYAYSAPKSSRQRVRERAVNMWQKQLFVARYGLRLPSATTKTVGAILMVDSVCSASWSAVAAVAAVAAGVIVFFQVRQEARLNRLTIGVDSLLRLSEAWDSRLMVRRRKRAAKALLEGKPNKDVDDLLDWFETVALLVKRGGFDEEFTWHTFYWWMANYYVAALDYIRSVQADEGQETWKDLCDLMPRLFAREAGTQNWTTAGVLPSPDDVREFLEEEMRLAEAP